jgi:hypothetical protein
LAVENAVQRVYAAFERGQLALCVVGDEQHIGDIIVDYVIVRVPAGSIRQNGRTTTMAIMMMTTTR